METLHLFNPDNDMALACGDPYYMAPASALRMAAELSVLPAWYAPAGDSVWVDSTARAGRLEAQCVLPLPVDFVTGPSPLYNKVSPWGWNPSLLRRLRQAGLGEVCPSDGEMRRIRELSGRATAVEVLARLRRGGGLSGPKLVGESFLLRSADEVARFVGSLPAAVLKSPWSGSGRGIQYTSGGGFPLPLRGWAEHVLRTQQAVVGEPLYDKVADFAMEFRSGADGAVRFAGYSFFETDRRGIYKENLLASDAAIGGMLAAWLPEGLLRDVRQRLEEELSAVVAGAYQGFLGVDMMVCRTPEGGYALHPCVEINLRMNMGVVARLVCDRYLCPGVRGRYVIEYYPCPGEAVRADRALREACPLRLEGGRVRSGYLPLTPVDEPTAYQAYMVVG